MNREQFIKNFESENNWSLEFENEFAIFTQCIQNSKVDFQLNKIFWFMQICNSLDMDIFNSTWMEIKSIDSFLILTVRIKHKLEFED